MILLTRDDNRFSIEENAAGLGAFLDAPLPFTKTLHLILRWTYEILREHFRMLFRKMGRLKVELWVFWKFWEEAVQ
jgi:hypothetical protein